VVLLVNLGSFELGSGWGVLAPLWIALLVVVSAATASALTLTSLLGVPPGAALAQAAALTLARLPRVLAVAVPTWLLLVLGGVLVVPVFSFMPAMVAAIACRFVFDALGVPVADPLAPTAERTREEAAEASRKRFGP
jgi:hypothetical protein